MDGSEGLVPFEPDADTTRRILARTLGLAYRFVRSRLLLGLIGRVEGGHMKSQTLRVLLARYHGVYVGAHSYGSLLVPGRADRDTRIGRYVSIGPNVVRFGAAHPTEAPTMHPYWYHPTIGRAGYRDDVVRTPIVIEDDCWIGANAILLPGCTRIGTGAVVGAGSVVSHDVDDFAVVVGVPARQKSLRLTPEMRTQLLNSRPWQYGPSECERVLEEIVDGLRPS